MTSTYPHATRLSGSRYFAGPGAIIDALVADGLPGAIGWLGALGVAAFSFVFAINTAASQPWLLEGTLATTTPRWLRGPLAGLVQAPSQHAIVALTNFGLPAMFLFYCLAVLGCGRLRTRYVFGLVVLAQAVAMLGPSPYPSDQFPYLEFSRMWTQGLNPYFNPVFAAPHVGLLYGAAYWPGSLSPYGPLFTLLLAPVATLPLSAAYWTSRIAILVAVLMAVWLCGACAEEVGGLRSRSVALVGLNPLIIYYCVAGAHNDVLAVLPVLIAMWMLLRARHSSMSLVKDRVMGMLGSDGMIFSAGLLLAVGAGFKASVLVVAPALLVATQRRRVAVLGFLAGGVGIWLVTVVCFGGYLPALGQQSQFVDLTSFGSLFGRALGVGGETGVIQKVFEVLLFLSVAATTVMAWRRPLNAFTYAGWATLALVATLSWQEPWYAIIFMCPASCSRSNKLKVACFTVGLLLVLLYLPANQWLTGRPDTLNLLQANQLRISQS